MLWKGSGRESGGSVKQGCGGFWSFWGSAVRFLVSCALKSDAACGCVFPDLGCLSLWRSLYAACSLLINPSFV